ncbi:MAG: hypothetical protein R3E01_28525 [Pirellulaceae bacterium]|nr:hypothetical protein [Planctomycetales bacterium]
MLRRFTNRLALVSLWGVVLMGCASQRPRIPVAVAAPSSSVSSPLPAARATATAPRFGGHVSVGSTVGGGYPQGAVSRGYTGGTYTGVPNGMGPGLSAPSGGMGRATGGPMSYNPWQ